MWFKIFVVLFFCCNFKIFAIENFIWQAPEKIANEGSGNPYLFVDREGNAASIWMEQDNTIVTVKTATKFFGQSWSHPINLSQFETATTIDQFFSPKIALDGSLNVIAVWNEHDINNKSILRTCTKPYNEEWSLPSFLSKPAKAVVDVEAQLAVDTRGNALVVWKRISNEKKINVLYATKSFDQSLWSDSSLLCPDSSLFYLNEAQGLPNLAMNPRGDAVVVWTYFPDNTRYYLQASTKLRDQPWEQPVFVSVQNRDSWLRLNNVRGGKSMLAVNAHGDAVVIWTPTFSEVYVSEKKGNTDWTPPINLANASTTPFYPLSTSVAIDNFGNLAAAWLELDVSGKILLKSSFKGNEEKWSSPTTLGCYTKEDLPGPKISLSSLKVKFDLEGNSVIAWVKYTNGTGCIQVIKESLKGTEVISDDVYETQDLVTELYMELDENGNVLMLWEEGAPFKKFITSIVGVK